MRYTIYDCNDCNADSKLNHISIQEKFPNYSRFGMASNGHISIEHPSIFVTIFTRPKFNESISKLERIIRFTLFFVWPTFTSTHHGHSISIFFFHFIFLQIGAFSSQRYSYIFNSLIYSMVNFCPLHSFVYLFLSTFHLQIRQTSNEDTQRLQSLILIVVVTDSNTKFSIHDVRWLVNKFHLVYFYFVCISINHTYNAIDMLEWRKKK